MLSDWTKRDGSNYYKKPANGVGPRGGRQPDARKGGGRKKERAAAGARHTDGMAQRHASVSTNPRTLQVNEEKTRRGGGCRRKDIVRKRTRAEREPGGKDESPLPAYSVRIFLTSVTESVSPSGSL